MIVKYVRERRENPDDDEDSFVTFGKEYLVLGMSFDASGEKWETHYVTTLDDDGDGAGGIPLKCFDIIDPSIPPNWTLEYGDFYNRYYLSPQKFHGDFWERYHDSDPDAKRIFEEVYRDIQGFHGIEVSDPESEKKPENSFDWSDKWLRDE